VRDHYRGLRGVGRGGYRTGHQACFILYSKGRQHFKSMRDFEGKKVAKILNLSGWLAKHLGVSWSLSSPPPINRRSTPAIFRALLRNSCSYLESAPRWPLSCVGCSRAWCIWLPRWSSMIRCDGEEIGNEFHVFRVVRHDTCHFFSEFHFGHVRRRKISDMSSTFHRCRRLWMG